MGNGRGEERMNGINAEDLRPAVLCPTVGSQQGEGSWTPSCLWRSKDGEHHSPALHVPNPNLSPPLKEPLSGLGQHSWAPAAQPLPGCAPAGPWSALLMLKGGPQRARAWWEGLGVVLASVERAGWGCGVRGARLQKAVA